MTSVNELRCRLFRQGRVEPEKLPPAKDTLIQHIRRAHYQDSVWTSSLKAYPQLDSPLQNGWQIDTDGRHLKPILTTIEPAPQTCVAIVSCGCKSCSTARCKYRQGMMICTPACSCVDSVCSNPYNGQLDILTSGIMLNGLFTQEPLCDQIKDLGIVPREDSDQARHLQSLIKSPLCALKR